MITKKREMAEWILDFFRRANADAGHVVMMRNVQNKLYELNPKERDMFVPVANELIKNGYFTYEEGTLQVLRLTEKGRDYIYNPNVELDCCYEEQKLTPTQSQYLSNWHNSFVNWVNGVLGTIEFLSIQPVATDEDRQALSLCKSILNGYEVGAVEESLSKGTVTSDVLDMIERLNKRKEFLRRLCYLRIEADKESEKARLGALKIKLN